MLAVAVLSARLYFGREAEQELWEGEMADFHQLAPPVKPAQFLMCPPNFCSRQPDAASPVFAMSWERTRDFWLEAVAHQPRVRLVAGDGDRRVLAYIQQSPVFRFPDIITVEFVVLPDGKSSFAVESHSRYGHYDFGVNRERVQEWAGLVKQMTAR